MTPPAKHRKQDMKTRQLTTEHDRTTDYEQLTGLRDKEKYALRRGLGFWELTFEGRQAIFKHEQGALYVACLLLDPPPEPIHAVALALKARNMGGQAAGAGRGHPAAEHGAGRRGGGPGPVAPGARSWSGCWRTSWRSSR